MKASFTLRQWYAVTTMSLIVLVAGCKTSRVVTGEIRKMKSKELVQEVMDHSFSYRYISAVAKVRFVDSSGLPGVTVSMRLQKDAIIWLTVSKLLQVAKAMITPDSIRAINKLERTYMTEPFSYLRSAYGVPARFNLMQQLLIGELPVTDYRTLESDVVENRYRLSGSSDGISYQVFIEPETYNITRIVLTEENSPRGLDVSYGDYKTTDGGPFPHQITIRTSGEVSMAVELSLSNVRRYENLEFPFEIPVDYRRM